MPAAAIGAGAALALAGVAFATLGSAGPDLEAARAAEAAAEAQVAQLASTLDGAEASRKALIDDLDAAHARIAALTECLGGTQVALQFARDGLMGLADRAMEAVAVACFEARQGD